MPLHCIGERRNLSEDDVEMCSLWSDIPESLLLQIFSYLDARSLVSIAQTCKVWCRVAYDESLWKALLLRTWGISGVQLPLGRDSWYLEYRRLRYNCPVILSEVLTDHSDEVLHVSFSNRGDLFSTTSKDASIKVWQVGYPTTLKYTKDFRELLGWDFTQFSCFNKSDTMLLVSSVKTTDFMDRRGFVAILSVLHSLQILRVVSMDPSQLFGAWLDDNTFLGGYLEISLDRFATTVQIESFQVDENSPLSNDCTPVIEEGVGQNLFTFSSETASLIKFLTVAGVSNQDLKTSPSANCKVKDVAMTTEDDGSGMVCLVSKDLAMITEDDKSGRVCLVSKDLAVTTVDDGSGRVCLDSKDLAMTTEDDGSGRVCLDSKDLAMTTEDDKSGRVCLVSKDLAVTTVDDGSGRVCLDSKDLAMTTEDDGSGRVCLDSKDLAMTTEDDGSGRVCLDSKDVAMTTVDYGSGMVCLDSMDLAMTTEDDKSDRVCLYSRDVAMTTEDDGSGMVCLDSKTIQSKHQRPAPGNIDCSCNCPKTVYKNRKVETNSEQCEPFVSYASARVENHESSSVVTGDTSPKNLIFVTGEFAVALHQLGIKNVSTESLSKSTPSPNEESMDVPEESHHMVVNFSNNDIHVQPFRKSDKPDHLIDLFGHVTGLCLSRDNRYLYLNYRPWIGKVDRNDPWATPDLSPSIEVLVIDLLNLQNEGVQYVGHKGYSPSTMCCFVFLDVSNDYVGSGSEDARGYLWDKHFRNNLAVYEHSWGVVNAVGFNPANQEYMVTVSDDNTIKIWRSRSEIRKLGPHFDSSLVPSVEADKCVNKARECESDPAAQGT